MLLEPVAALLEVKPPEPNGIPQGYFACTKGASENIAHYIQEVMLTRCGLVSLCDRAPGLNARGQNSLNNIKE
jgi:hypothetical protein